METRLKNLLDKKLYRDILTFFYKNQTSVDSVGGISTWVGDSRENVHSALDKLVKMGVLNEDSQGVTKGYCYTRDEEIMDIIEELMQDAKS
ncbi:MAG: hypothetical protein WBD00_06740 [Candidatus Omnitrophota bacterium]